MNLSISDLFVGGLLPGVLMVIAMQIACYVVCKKNGWGELISFSPKNSLIKGGQAYLGFMAIFIVIFGIYGGIFSPTEAAGVTAGFCLLSGIFITKGIKIKNIPKIILRSGKQNWVITS
jgi:C4-dicarboxylate transporter DctM subunit